MKPINQRQIDRLAAQIGRQTDAINALAANIAALVESNMMMLQAFAERDEDDARSDAQTLDLG